MIFKTLGSMIMVFCIVFPVLGQEQSPDYRIGPRDLLTITVFEVPELNQEVRVSEDGTLNLPLLGKIQVAGLTRFELEKTLVTLLEKTYLKNAQVSIFIKEYQSKKVSVMGAVQKPGDYDVIGRQLLMSLISKAGGMTEKATDRIIIIRQYANGKSKPLIIDRDDLMLKGNPIYNIPLKAGDVVNVAMESFLDIYIFGQVKNSGAIRVKKDGEITLLKAIAQAGGFSDRARTGAITVTRRINGKEEKIKINVKQILSGKAPDFVLMNNDIVNVPESVL